MPADDKTKDQNKDQLDLTKNPQFAQLTALVTQMGKGMQALQKLATDQTTHIEGLTKVIKDGTKPLDKKEEKPATDDDVNNMSQAQLTGHIFKGVRGMLDSVKGELTKSLEAVSTNVERTNLTSEVNKVREAHTDFDDWIPEIKERLNANPNLSVDDAYFLSRRANAEKATQMDDKYKTDLEKKKGNGEEKPAFGGLTPTSRLGLEKTDDGDKQLTTDQAVEKAWGETFGDNPSLAGEDSLD